MQHTVRLRLKPSISWLALSIGLLPLLLLVVWRYPLLPPSLQLTLLAGWDQLLLQGLLSLLLLLYAVRSWRQWRSCDGWLTLRSNGELFFTQQTTGSDGTVMAASSVSGRLTGRAGISQWCCRFTLQPLTSEPLPAGWQQPVLFSDSLSQADYRALCRWLNSAQGAEQQR